MYIIYRITGPTGKSYIGLTKSKLRERWRQHVKRAMTEPRNHPFYNAIRKYGKKAFTVEEIDYAPDKPSAQKLEMRYIANHNKELLYNLSPGGEADGEAGSKIFWDYMNANPEAKKAYIEKLSEVKKGNDWSDYDAMQEKAQEWRKNNPKEAYKKSLRALRIANRNKPKREVGPIDLKTRLMRKHNRSKISQIQAKKQWADMTHGQKAELSAKISSSVKESWKKVKDPNKRSELTKIAREAIDRKKQGEAASKGLKSFWVELKKDPERYAEYIAKRNASLKKTLIEQGKKVA